MLLLRSHYWRHHHVRHRHTRVHGRPCRCAIPKQNLRAGYRRRNHGAQVVQESRQESRCLMRTRTSNSWCNICCSHVVALLVHHLSLMLIAGGSSPGRQAPRQDSHELVRHEELLLLVLQLLCRHSAEVAALITGMIRCAREHLERRRVQVPERRRSSASCGLRRRGGTARCTLEAQAVHEVVKACACGRGCAYLRGPTGVYVLLSDLHLQQLLLQCQALTCSRRHRPRVRDVDPGVVPWGRCSRERSQRHCRRNVEIQK
mmetsp:Transcript_332/g.649  ORF Transcript_332/g.649 Transcript_332/m.649 type:complete len:260 (-) Transcript_332:1955-2734(-)